jgi:hypothetical protein
MLEDVPLSQTLTPATVLGRSLETTIILFTFSGLFLAFFGPGIRQLRRERQQHA